MKGLLRGASRTASTRDVFPTMAIFLLKENIAPRAWLGLAFCVLGADAISYGPPEGQPGNLFYWGLSFAALAAVGWGAEGVLATSGMDFIEPAVALNKYYTISSILYVLSIIPLVSVIVFPQAGVALLAQLLTSKGAAFVAVAGITGAFSFFAGIVP